MSAEDEITNELARTFPVLIALVQRVDVTCRELAWWTLPTAPPDELTAPARAALRELRTMVPPLPPDDGESPDE